MRLALLLPTLAAGLVGLTGWSPSVAAASPPGVRTPVAHRHDPAQATPAAARADRPVGPNQRLARRLARRPAFSVRATGASVAWLTRVDGPNGTLVDQVSVYDTEQEAFWVRDQPAVPAIPRLAPGDWRVTPTPGLPLPDAGHGAEPGRVSALTVLDLGFVAWIANGTTVVVGAQVEGDYDLGPVNPNPRTGKLRPTIYGPDDELRSSRGLAIAGRYPDEPAVRAALHASLSLRPVDDIDPGMPGAPDQCSYLASAAYGWREPDGTPRLVQAYVGRERVCRENQRRREARRRHADAAGHGRRR
jgi:hypothetical protein